MLAFLNEERRGERIGEERRGEKIGEDRGEQRGENTENIQLVLNNHVLSLIARLT
jgi:hypothetical protein